MPIAKRYSDGNRGDKEGDPTPVSHPGKEVAAELVGAQKMGKRRALKAISGHHLDRIEIGDLIGEEGARQKHQHEDESDLSQRIGQDAEHPSGAEAR